jgi:hypothetical protein
VIRTSDAGAAQHNINSQRWSAHRGPLSTRPRVKSGVAYLSPSWLLITQGSFSCLAFLVFCFAKIVRRNYENESHGTGGALLIIQNHLRRGSARFKLCAHVL